MVNFSVLMAVVFLWRFRLRVIPLSLSPSCVTHKKTSRKKVSQVLEKSTRSAWSAWAAWAAVCMVCVMG